MQHSPLYSEILSRIAAVRSRENRVELTYGLLVSSIVAVLLVVSVVILEQLFSFGVIGRTILAAIAVAGIAGVIAWLAGPALLRLSGLSRARSDGEIALKIGRHFPAVRDRLLDALQMFEQKELLGTIYSPALIDASFADLHRSIQGLDFTAVVDSSRIRRMRKYGLTTLGIGLLVFVLSPSGFLGSFDRIVHFGTSYAAGLPGQLEVEPGNIEVVRGQDVTVTVRASGGVAGSPELFIRPGGILEFEPSALTTAGPGAFTATLHNLKQSTEYYAAAGEVSTAKFMINVLDRPIIRSLQLRLVPPAYTKLPVSTLEENRGDVSGYPGSRVEFQLQASKPLDSASMVFTGGDILPLAVKDSRATGALTIRTESRYRIMLRDADGLTNIDPIQYSITVIPDEYPAVEILSPGKNIDITEEKKLNLYIGVKDDFGYSKLRLAYRLAHSRYEQPAEEFTTIDIPLPAGHQGPMQIPFLWDLDPLHLVPEDAVAYYAEIFDNDVVSGPKSARSEMYIVRLPSLDEVFKDVAENQQQSMESMQQVAKEAEQLKKDVDEMQREIRKNPNKSDWQQQKKAENMLQRYEAMKNKLEDASRKMDEMMKQAQDNKLLSEQTLQKYQEMQKLMEELKSPELQKALQKLQESMKQMTPEQMRQAMEQMQFNEDQFRQNLERTIELLKRIAIEQKIDEVIKRTADLKRQQEELRKQTEQSKDAAEREQLAAKQEDLQKQMESLERETADLKEKMEEFAKEMPLEEMNKAQKSLQQSKPGDRMQQSARKMQQGEMQEAGEQQQQTEQALNEFQQEMEQVRKALQSQQQKEIVNALRKQMQNLVELSKRQEELKSESQGLDQNSRQFRNQAQEQNEIVNDLGNVAQAMSEIAKKSFAVSPEMGKEIGDAMKQMAEAMKQMENRNPGGTAGAQSGAMGSLNRAAMLTQNALNGMMQGGQSGGSGMAGLMSRLGQMSGMQGGINQGTQNAMGMGQGQGLSPQQQAEYGRLAGQQAAVQKSLEELVKEAKNAGEFSKLLGDLDRVAQDMIEVQTDLEQGDISPETLQKQERILSRLLDSQRSVRERDYEKRRKAEPGKEYERSLPGEIDLTTQEGRNRLRQEMLKVLEGKYTRDYEELIRRYFEQLEKEETPQPR
jgi:hypothetical protein